MSSKELPKKLAEWKEARREKELEEYRRLLYVAMTRAEDRLYICGARGEKEAPENCWHKTAWKALEGVAEVQGDRLVLATPGTAPVRKEAALLASPPLPAVLRTPAPAESEAGVPLSPSRLWDKDAPAASPLAGADIYKRGALIHRLLQHLPKVPPAERERVAKLMGAEEEMLPEVLHLLAAPEFAHFFAEGSLAEVPLGGRVLMEGREQMFAGQVDRLLVTENEVWVLDYKTGAVPGETPPRYLRQMAAYRALLAGIYPGREIRCALLWTSAPALVELPPAALDALCQPLTQGAGEPKFLRA